LRIRPPRPIDGHKGELLFEQDQLQNGRAADALFREALAIAQQQRAKSWELRATTSLARLWSAQSRRREAYDLLAPLYDWFTEGFDTVPLKEARELLDTLRDTRRFGSGQRRRGAGRPFGWEREQSEFAHWPHPPSNLGAR